MYHRSTVIAGDVYKRQVLEEALQQEEKIKAIAARYTHVQHTFFLGRGFDNAVAMEGALKLKETSYIHAEAYACLLYTSYPVST